MTLICQITELEALSRNTAIVQDMYNVHYVILIQDWACVQVSLLLIVVCITDAANFFHIKSQVYSPLKVNEEGKKLK